MIAVFAIADLKGNFYKEKSEPVDPTMFDGWKQYGTYQEAEEDMPNALDSLVGEIGQIQKVYIQNK